MTFDSADSILSENMHGLTIKAAKFDADGELTSTSDTIKYVKGAGLSTTSGETAVGSGFVIEVPEGQLAYNFTMELEHFFIQGTNNWDMTATEMGTIKFYKGDVLVYSVERFEANSDDPDVYSVHSFPIIAGGFDSVHLFPVDNNATNSDNSEFIVHSLSFEPQIPTEHVLHGRLEGLDEALGTELVITQLGGLAEGSTDTLVVDGLEVTLAWSEDGTRVTGTTIGDTAAPAFDLALNPITGEFTLHQYIDFDATLDFDVSTQGTESVTVSQSIDALSSLSQGTDASDFVLGTEGDDVLEGYIGDDWLFGHDGDDKLYGGLGHDTLDGGLGEDSIYGGDGDDLVKLDITDLLVDGGDGLDVLLGGIADKDEAMDRVAGNHIHGVEVMVFGNVEGNTTADVLAELDVTTSGEGEETKVSVNESVWSAKGTTGEFTEFSNGEGNEAVTILVRTDNLA